MPSPSVSRKTNRRAKNIEDVIEPARIRRATLFEAYSEIAAEWHYKKNCGWSPEDFNYGSNVKAWWQCPNDKKHIYAAPIANRTVNESGCMICNTGESTDLRDYPSVLAQFDHKKNKGIDPFKLPWHDKVHWKCSAAKDHVWVSTFNRRSGERCPFCTNRKLSKTNSLANFPKVAKYVHPTKNGKLTAKDFRASEGTVIWWKCPKGKDHEWQAKISTKTGGSIGCPFCISNRVSITNCLASRFPKIAKEWHPTKNKPETTKSVNGSTANKYWWKCKLGHVWRQGVQIRTIRGANCPTCRKLNTPKKT
ncbi:MAG: zinc-ribbon domain-containing protein [Candidatus Obscuribacterales bacterium]